MRSLAITGLGPDRPGIVAGVTQVLFELGASLVDCSMTLLEGQFAFILIASAPVEISPPAFQVALRPVEERLGVRLFVSEIHPSQEEPAPPVPSEAWMISVAGHDRTGITYRVCELLAAFDISVTDLEARLIEGDGGPVYVMMIEATVPTALDRPAFEAQAAALAEALEVEIRHHPIDAPTL